MADEKTPLAPEMEADINQNEPKANENKVHDASTTANQGINDSSNKSDNNGEITLSDHDKPTLLSKGSGLRHKLSSKLSSALSRLDSLDTCDADIVITLLRNPSIKVLSSLNRRLKSEDTDWVDDFMDNEGFEVRSFILNA